MLLRFREAGAELQQLKEVYIAKIRPVLEYGCQVITPMLNGLQTKELESVQRQACIIILGRKASSYAENLVSLRIPSLYERRELLVREFAISVFRNHKHRWWFQPSPPPIHPTRVIQPRPRFAVPQGKKNTRLDKSPLAEYSRILNTISEEEWQSLELPPPSSCVNRPNTMLNQLYLTQTVERLPSPCQPPL